MIFESQSLEQTKEIAVSIVNSLELPSCIYLQGDLGAGKTTLCKFIIEILGYQGVVTSPTYNLIQEYVVGSTIVYHIDLYRLQDPEELEFLAIGDLWSDQCLLLIEWPNRGGALIPTATHRVTIKDQSDNLRINKHFDVQIV